MTGPARRLPQRRRLRGFLLTPLIDVIFLLLVFFMVCSQVAPYSLVELASSAQAGGAASAAPTEAEPSERPDSADGTEIVLILSRGHIRAGASTITLAQLPEALAVMKEEGVRDALLLTNRSATVQDVATALEAFRASGLDRVRFAAPQRSPTSGTRGG
ncbi:biopolymer transporter ExbD [Fulvimarina sp. MAC3]|uniref:ExbD/TolR family protein n=1 Tax=Fulvimarina sp. MAC3 TaxID=3148887 RepID=UPI0031FD0B0E